MQKRFQKFLLIMLALALTIAPLRSAWAVPDIPATETESHCAQLEIQAAASGTSESQHCKKDCNGSCCDASCNSCVPAASAISGSLALKTSINANTHDHAIRMEFSGRTVIPPLRPPATL
ncbi:MAG: hypothetical protein OEV12_07830 [Gammaproteobacteria bacterium]|nr:hypothetical protein [Gammaproteobacteria bacterium]MDH3887515.1 hypothetical protein [Gammaproteobacteria bacterium]MDH3986302.1 hypothetical protein [Gammaproteobacteria bacterium]